MSTARSVVASLGLAAAASLGCGDASKVASVPGPGAAVDPARLVQPLARIRVFAGRDAAPVVTGFIPDTPIVLVAGTWREAAAPIQASAFAVDSTGWVYASTAEPQLGGAMSALRIRRWTGSSWEPFGPIVPSTPVAGDVFTLDVDLANRLAIGWGVVNGPQAFGGWARWTGSAWSTGSIDLARPDQLLAFAVGREVAAWSVGWVGSVSAVTFRPISGGPELGASWTFGEPIPVAVAVSAGDVPAIARLGFVAPAGPERLHVERWTGTTFGKLAGDVAQSDARTIRDVALAAGGGDALAVAWSDGEHVEVRRWAGAGWTPVGGPRGHRAPALAFDASGALLVAWLERAGTSDGVALYTPRIERFAR